MEKVKRKDGLKRQAQIMELALLLFSKNGYHATSVDDILNEAKIAKGTFYLHFESKIDLLEKIIDSRFDIIIKNTEILDISVFKNIDEMKKIYVGIADFLTGFAELKVFMRLILKEYTVLEPQIFNKINMFMEKMVLISADNIRKAQVDGKVNQLIDPYVSSLCIVGSVKELAFRWSVINEDIDIKKTVAAMFDVFIKGLTTTV